MRIRRVALICGAFVTISTGNAVFAQTDYPAKPVRWIVPYAPGGGTDIMARTVAQKLGEIWGRQVLVDNRPGGATNIGIEAAARAAPDGYTLVSPTVANAINATLFPKLNFDIMRDFAHITNIGKSPHILVVHPAVPAKNVKEFIALGKSRSNTLRQASPGIGSPQHLAGEIFKMMTGVQMVHIPYKGAAPALTDVVGGHVEVYFGAIVSTIQHVKNGKVRPLGVASLKRVETFPALATLDEQGVKGFETASWVMISAPANTPRDLITRINRDAARVIASADVRERLKAEGTDPVGDTPEQVTAYLKSEIEKWGRAVKASGATPEG